MLEGFDAHSMGQTRSLDQEQPFLRYRSPIAPKGIEWTHVHIAVQLMFIFGSTHRDFVVTSAGGNPGESIARHDSVQLGALRQIHKLVNGSFPGY